MLYVFHVDYGRMITFDMNLALESVQHLQIAIERACNIPVMHQVLLVSGGEILQPTLRVCNYSSGTDTNPIYMFSTDTKDLPQPWPSIDTITDEDLKIKLEHGLALPPTLETVRLRTQLAQHIYELAREEIKICERLVHDQHLQQQGWAAVIANMEDLTDEFRIRFEDFMSCFNEYMRRHSTYSELLLKFNDDLNKLAKIPILPSLMPGTIEKFHGFDEYLDTNESIISQIDPDGVNRNVNAAINKDHPDDDNFSIDNNNINDNNSNSNNNTNNNNNNNNSNNNDNESSHRKLLRICSREAIPSDNQDGQLIDQRKPKILTLLQWISVSENENELRNMAANCASGLEKFDETSMQALKENILKTIKLAKQEDIKQIKGLENRLSGLEKLMFEARKTVQDQNEMATAFQQNQTRASNLGDASILPDLCASHHKQLVVMVKNYNFLRDIRRRISKAKDELSVNLNERLKFIVYIENRMSDLDNKLLFYHRSLRRVQKHLIVIEQIHQAPSIYVTAILEVIRRRTFSKAFLSWASDLASNLITIYDEELNRRREFASIFQGHFLNTLFPGMGDMPPQYATPAPTVFDTDLPLLTKSDVEGLLSQLIDVESKVQYPDLANIINFFTIKTINKTSEKAVSTTLTDKPVTDEIDINLKGSMLFIQALIKPGFDFETDTEEFEKVNESSTEQHHRQITESIPLETNRVETTTTSTSTDRITTRSIETLTEENLGTTRLELENIKSKLKLMYKLSNDNIGIFRDQLKEFRIDTNTNLLDFAENFQAISKTLKAIENECTLNEREIINRLTVDHELELNDIKKYLALKDDEIQTLKCDKLELENKMSTILLQHEQNKILLDEQIVDLQQKLSTLETLVDDKDKLMDEKETIIRNQKCEMDSLRNRFKQMTNLDRSPSESSLEKIERTDYDLQQQIVELQQKLVTLETAVGDKDKLIVEKETLIRGHKYEMDLLRNRFKLMTNLDRSPSDTSLEKIERIDYDLQQQSREDLSTLTTINKRGIAIATTTTTTTTPLNIILSGSPKSPTASATSSYHEFYRRIIDDKDRQLDTLREHNGIVSKENNRLKVIMQGLTDSEMNTNQFTRIKEQLDQLQKDKLKLEHELNVEKSKLTIMENSIALTKVVPMDASVGATGGIQGKIKLACPKNYASIEACAKGDLVIVVWNDAHGQFTIVQDAPVLYFLHADSHQSLNLQAPGPDVSLPHWTVGRIIDKEYCHARKDENRYKVSRGTRFYRVKVRPRSPTRNNETIKMNRRDNGNNDGERNQSSNLPTVSRSSSSQLIDSFAQTDILLDRVKEISTRTIATTATTTGTITINEDMVDSGVEAPEKSIYKERNISVTEEEEPLSLTLEHYRYNSVSEEDENISDNSRYKVRLVW